MKEILKAISAAVRSLWRDRGVGLLLAALYGSLLDYKRF